MKSIRNLTASAFAAAFVLGSLAGVVSASAAPSHSIQYAGQDRADRADKGDKADKGQHDQGDKGDRGNGGDGGNGGR